MRFTSWVSQSPIINESPSDNDDRRLSIAAGKSRSIQLFPLFNPLSMPETAALWTLVLFVCMYSVRSLPAPPVLKYAPMSLVSG